MSDYKTIFDRVEATLFEVGSRNLSVDQIQSNLEPFKRIGQTTLFDNDYYEILVAIIFYAGFKAETVNAKMEQIRRYFPD